MLSSYQLTTYVAIEKIALSGDAALEAQLETKLDEYRTRAATHESEYVRTDATFKVFVLAALLERRSIEPRGFGHELRQQLGGTYDHSHYVGACLVLNDYCTTGGANLIGGTGLPRVPAFEDTIQMGGDTLEIPEA